ncbi:MAG: DUF4263 domain-containing protein [Symploca sp. SIO2E9]|nr:DUF4263 domain-containing protein [Symploca sp. SIO2E9]
MSESTLRRIRKNFEKMPNATLFSSVPSQIEEHRASLKETKSDTETTDEALQKFIELAKKLGIDPVSRLIEIFTKEGIESSIPEITRLVDWITNTAKVGDVINVLERLEFDDLQKLNTAVELSNFKSVLSIWQANKENNSEEFWQDFFSQKSFVFAQLFSFPVIILKGKAYVGGNSYSNKGANIVDFLCANDLTKNTALIEIKTPKTKLLGSQYRGDVYNVSNELSGSIIQASNYKYSLLKHQV